MDLVKFAPSNLNNIPLSEIEALTTEQIGELAAAYYNMDGQLLIQRATRIGAISSATYRSLHSLLRSGHKFVIVGVKDAPIKKEEPIQLIDAGFIPIEQPIFEEPTIKKTRKTKQK